MLPEKRIAQFRAALEQLPYPSEQRVEKIGLLVALTHARQDSPTLDRWATLYVTLCHAESECVVAVSHARFLNPLLSVAAGIVSAAVLMRLPPTLGSYAAVLAGMVAFALGTAVSVRSYVRHRIEGGRAGVALAIRTLFASYPAAYDAIECIERLDPRSIQVCAVHTLMEEMPNTRFPFPEYAAGGPV